MKLNAALPICLLVARGVFYSAAILLSGHWETMWPTTLKVFAVSLFQENLAKSPFSAQHCDLCPSEERGFLACLFFLSYFMATQVSDC